MIVLKDGAFSGFLFSGCYTQILEDRKKKKTGMMAVMNPLTRQLMGAERSTETREEDGCFLILDLCTLMKKKEHLLVPFSGVERKRDKEK